MNFVLSYSRLIGYSRYVFGRSVSPVTVSREPHIGRARCRSIKNPVVLLAVASYIQARSVCTQDCEDDASSATDLKITPEQIKTHRAALNTFVRGDGTFGDGGYVNLGVLGPDEVYGPIEADSDDDETVIKKFIRRKNPIKFVEHLRDFVKHLTEKGIIAEFLKKLKDGPLGKLFAKEGGHDHLIAAGDTSNGLYTHVGNVWPERFPFQPLPPQPAPPRFVQDIKPAGQIKPVAVPVRPVEPPKPLPRPVPIHPAPIMEVPILPVAPQKPVKQEEGPLERLFKLFSGDEDKEKPEPPKWGLRISKVFVEALETFIKGTRTLLGDIEIPPPPPPK